jgi:uncharacterized protein YdeI (YjbR/CyaY-like superfamily)
MANTATRAPKAFRSPEHFREWLQRHHASATELVLRCFKVHAKHRGIGYQEGLDEALCFGWIDGVRRSLDNDSFTVRFTPRKKKSKWSVVNIKRAKELESEGRMQPTGLAAFRARSAIAVAPYSLEGKSITLDPVLEKKFRANKMAWNFFQTLPPWYRRTTVFWVMSAKREETRLRRFGSLLERCVQRRPVPEFHRRK